jgi:hypothetical protein
MIQTDMKARVIKRAPMPPGTDEFMKALERLGNHSVALMDWLLTFARRNFDELSKGDWLNLTYEVALFVWLNGPASPPSDYCEGVELKAETIPLPDPLVIKQCQAICRKHLDEFIAKGSTSFDVQSGMSMTVRKLRSGGCCMTYFSKEVTPGFKHAVARTLLTVGPDIERCPECEQLFIRYRRNMRFCSTKCLSRVTSRRLRKRRGAKPVRDGDSASVEKGKEYGTKRR